MSIRVVCKCGKEFRAKREHAGRRAKCPSCGQALQIVAADELKDSQAGQGIGDLIVAEGMRQGAAPSTGVPAAGAGQACPMCGAGAAATAVICVSCGYNFKSGGKHQTKHESPARSSNISLGAIGSKVRSSAGLLVKVALLVALVAGGWYGYRWYTNRVILTRILTPEDEKIPANMYPYVASRLPELVAIARGAEPQGVTLAPESYDAVVARAIGTLDPSADVEPLFVLTPEQQKSFDAAVAHIAAHKDIHWVVGTLVQAQPSGRVLLTRVVARHYPLSNPAIQDISTLAPNGTKDQLMLALQADCARAIGGAYTGKLEVVWTTDSVGKDGRSFRVIPNETRHNFDLDNRFVTITQENGKWLVTLGSKQWQGGLDNLFQSSLSMRLGDLSPDAAALPNFDAIAGREVKLTITKTGPQIQIENPVTYVPIQLSEWSGDYYDQAPTSPPRGFYVASDVKTQNFTRQGGAIPNSLVRTIVYRKDGLPGFSQVNVSLAKAD